MTGQTRSAHTQPIQIYNHYKLHRRFLGHLSAVYCVMYDRSGNYIFTVSSEMFLRAKYFPIWFTLIPRGFVVMKVLYISADVVNQIFSAQLFRFFRHIEMEWNWVLLRLEIAESSRIHKSYCF